MSLLLSTSERERYVKGTVIAHNVQRQPAPAEHRKHGLIFGEHLGLEAFHTCLPSDPSEMREDERRDA
ncbi:MAG TPA: hypothetical protein VFQ31_09510 [Methyloceanibacter sp.]|nr:hypothetical protein [Methyloceanibacter sp.]